METKKLRKEVIRLGLYLEKHEATKRELMSVVKKIEIEDAKDYIEQYLLTPRVWYSDREAYLSNLLMWIEKRIEAVTCNIERYGK